MNQANGEKLQIDPDLKEISTQSRLHQLLTKEPHIYTWLTADYTHKDIKKAIGALKNNKSHGSGGIPGVGYKVLRKRIIIPIANNEQNKKRRRTTRRIGSMGVIVRIYKQKGEVDECVYRRSIWLTEIIYKIWERLLTKRISKILHTITPQQQYGRNTNLSTEDAVINWNNASQKQPGAHT